MSGEAEHERRGGERVSGLTPERAARLLRAKAGELENYVYVCEGVVPSLAADIALVAQLLAEHIERTAVAQ